MENINETLRRITLRKPGPEKHQSSIDNSQRSQLKPKPPENAQQYLNQLPPQIGGYWKSHQGEAARYWAGALAPLELSVYDRPDECDQQLVRLQITTILTKQAVKTDPKIETDTDRSSILDTIDQISRLEAEDIIFENRNIIGEIKSSTETLRKYVESTKDLGKAIIRLCLPGNTKPYVFKNALPQQLHLLRLARNGD